MSRTKRGARAVPGRARRYGSRAGEAYRRLRAQSTPSSGHTRGTLRLIHAHVRSCLQSTTKPWMGGALKNELGALASDPARLSAKTRGGLRDPHGKRAGDPRSAVRYALSGERQGRTTQSVARAAGGCPACDSYTCGTAPHHRAVRRSRGPVGASCPAPSSGRGLDRAKPEWRILRRQAWAPRRPTQAPVRARITAWAEGHHAAPMSMTGSSTPRTSVCASKRYDTI